MQIATCVIAVLLAFAFLAAGGAKIAALPLMRESANHLGISYSAYRGIGVLEIAGVLGLAVGYANKDIGVAAGIGLFLLLIGAVGSHFRSEDSFARMTPALVLGVLAAAYIGLRLALN